MTICNADFEAKFPAPFGPKRPAAAARAPGPIVACIARWEDDGGRTPAKPARRAPPAQASSRPAAAAPELIMGARWRTRPAHSASKLCVNGGTVEIL